MGALAVDSDKTLKNNPAQKEKGCADVVPIHMQSTSRTSFSFCV